MTCHSILTGPRTALHTESRAQPPETKAWENRGSSGAGYQLDSYAPPAGPAKENDVEYPSLPFSSGTPPPWSSFSSAASTTPVIK